MAAACVHGGALAVAELRGKGSHHAVVAVSRYLLPPATAVVDARCEPERTLELRVDRGATGVVSVASLVTTHGLPCLAVLVQLADRSPSSGHQHKSAASAFAVLTIPGLTLPPSPTDVSTAVLPEVLLGSPPRLGDGPVAAFVSASTGQPCCAALGPGPPTGTPASDSVGSALSCQLWWFGAWREMSKDAGPILLVTVNRSRWQAHLAPSATEDAPLPSLPVAIPCEYAAVCTAVDILERAAGSVVCIATSSLQIVGIVGGEIVWCVDSPSAVASSLWITDAIDDGEPLVLSQCPSCAEVYRPAQGAAPVASHDLGAGSAVLLCDVLPAALGLDRPIVLQPCHDGPAIRCLELGHAADGAPGQPRWGPSSGQPQLARVAQSLATQCKLQTARFNEQLQMLSAKERLCATAQALLQRLDDGRELPNSVGGEVAGAPSAAHTWPLVEEVQPMQAGAHTVVSVAGDRDLPATGPDSAAQGAQRPYRAGQAFCVLGGSDVDVWLELLQSSHGHRGHHKLAAEVGLLGGSAGTTRTVVSEPGSFGDDGAVWVCGRVPLPDHDGLTGPERVVVSCRLTWQEEEHEGGRSGTGQQSLRVAIPAQHTNLGFPLDFSHDLHGLLCRLAPLQLRLRLSPQDTAATVELLHPISTAAGQLFARRLCPIGPDEAATHFFDPQAHALEGCSLSVGLGEGAWAELTVRASRVGQLATVLDRIRPALPDRARVVVDTSSDAVPELRALLQQLRAHGAPSPETPAAAPALSPERLARDTALFSLLRVLQDMAAADLV